MLTYNPSTAPRSHSHSPRIVPLVSVHRHNARVRHRSLASIFSVRVDKGRCIFGAPLFQTFWFYLRLVELMSWMAGYGYGSGAGGALPA